jgi:hypothetical protein
MSKAGKERCLKCSVIAQNCWFKVRDEFERNETTSHFQLKSQKLCLLVTTDKISPAVHIGQNHAYSNLL